MKNDAIFQQDRSQKASPGGPFPIQLLFREPTELPDKETMTAVMERRVGPVECFCYDGSLAGFSAREHIAHFQDKDVPVQLMVMGCKAFSGAGIDDFTRNQMWDCLEDRDTLLTECRYQVMAVDMLTSALPARERADLDMDFLEALAELYPACAVFYFPSCGKLLRAEEVQGHHIPREDRFIRFGVNVRFFNIQGTGDRLIDTVGMSTLFLPDLQYHFHTMDPNWVVGHAYDLASYILQNDSPIQPGETINGIEGGELCAEIKWPCQYEEALIQPVREVLDVCMGQYAAGQRE